MLNQWLLLNQWNPAKLRCHGCQMKTLRRKGWAGALLFVTSLWIYWTHFFFGTDENTARARDRPVMMWAQFAFSMFVFFRIYVPNLFLLQDDSNRPTKKVTTCQIFEMCLTFIWLFSSNLPHQTKSVITFYPCKHARIESSECTCVLCLECYNKMTEGDVEGPTDGRRISKRSIKADQSGGFETNHHKDLNGCRHSDPNFFQHETNLKYYDERYRDTIPECKRISRVCLTCKKSVLG